MLEAEDEDAARAIIEERAPLFGPELLDMMEESVAQFEETGNAEAAARIRALLPFAEQHIGTGHHHHHDHDHDHPHTH